VAPALCRVRGALSAVAFKAWPSVKVCCGRPVGLSSVSGAARQPVQVAAAPRSGCAAGRAGERPSLAALPNKGIAADRPPAGQRAEGSGRGAAAVGGQETAAAPRKCRGRLAGGRQLNAWPLDGGKEWTLQARSRPFRR